MLGFSKNTWLLAIAQPFAMAASPAIVFISGFVGKQLAPSPELATLPISLMIVGVTLGAIPSGRLMRRFGRKKVFIGSLVNAIFGFLLAALGIYLSSFFVFLLGIVFAGMTLAIIQQFRFAAIESLNDKSYAPRAVSLLMMSTILAAFVGPELANWGRNWFAIEYLGSFLALILAAAVGMVVLLFYSDSSVASPSKYNAPPAWSLLLQRPQLLLAVLAATIGYGVMSFVMTATPLAMSDMMGHSMTDTKWVIQSHIIAMFLPSLFSGELIRWWGEKKVILLGVVAYLLTTIVAFMGVQVLHYWWALVLLGVGWNFLFVGGTSLLAKSYSEDEKFSVQAMNDTAVFVFQAAASLFAGVVLFSAGWTAVISIALVPTVLLLVYLLVFTCKQVEQDI